MKKSAAYYTISKYVMTKTQEEFAKCLKISTVNHLDHEKEYQIQGCAKLPHTK